MKTPSQKPQDEEWEDPYPKKKKTHWITGLILVVVLYVLSIGPVFAFLAAKGVISDKTYQAIYMPLGALGERSPAVENALKWYVGLWK